MNKLYQFREFTTKDNHMVTNFPRAPKFCSPDQFLAIAQPKDFSKRVELSKENRAEIIEDLANGKPIGSYGAHIKQVNFLGREKTLIQTFDFVVDPNYRGKNFSEMLNKRLGSTIEKEFQKNTIDKPIFTGYVAHGNELMKGRMLKAGLEIGPTTIAYAWQLDSPVHQMLPDGYSATVWQESNMGIAQEKMEKAFKNYLLSPVSLNELLVHCKNYVTNCYFLQLKKDGEVVSESSISVWNTDLLCTIKDNQGKEHLHRQLFSCYSLGDSQEHRDLSFQYLLKHVHNDQLSLGVKFLFLELSESDPVSKHFPLLPGIKNNSYYVFIAIHSLNEKRLFKESLKSGVPTFIDPRDFGIVFLQPEAPLLVSKL